MTQAREPAPNGDTLRAEVEALSRELALTKAELAEGARVAERMRALSQLTRELAQATSDPQQLLDLVSRRLGQLIGESCVMRLLEVDDARRHGPGALYHEDPDVARRLKTALEASRGDSRGISAGVQATGRAVILNGTTDEIAAQVHPSFAQVLRERGCSSLLSAPIRTGGRVIGVVTMRRSVGTYSEEERAFVEEILDHVALAIDNSRLLESTRRELAERARTEEALRRAEEQFRQAQKMEAIGRLAGGVAHDFNNLLSVILGCATIVLEQLEPADPSVEDVRQIEIAAQRAADLTHQLLAFSRSQVLKPELLDLNLVVREVEAMIRRLVNEDVVIHSELAHEPMVVKVDRGHLSQVLMNLAINARDAMPDGGTLRLATRRALVDANAAQPSRDLPPGQYVVLAVSDSGTGMDEATRQRIFEPFFTTKERGKGTGLGLSTVLGIVQQSGGSVFVDSAPSAGSTFEVFLPADAEQAQQVTAKPAALSARAGSILLVEDDIQVRQVARRILERHGYTVLVASSGPSALELFDARGSEVDLLLTDVVMPKMNGRDLAERLTARRAGLRVLYMTGYTEDTVWDPSNASAGNELLAKPFSAEQLLTRVRELLAR